MSISCLDLKAHYKSIDLTNQEYLNMKISLELYESFDTQESIKRAREDLSCGRFKDYEDIEQLIKELHEGKNQDT